MAEVEGEGDSFESDQGGVLETDEEEQAKVVAQFGVGGVVVDEVTKVIEDSVGDCVEHVGRVASHERCSRGAACCRGVPDISDGLGDHVRPQWGETTTMSASMPPMTPSNQSGVPSRRSAYATPADRTPRRSRGGWSVIPNDADASTAPSEDGRSTGSCHVGAGTDAGDPRVGEVPERVAQRVEAEVESVVVGESDTVHAEELQHLGSDRGARKKNGFLGSGQWFPRSEIAHSRFRTKKSASWAATTTSSEKSASGGTTARRPATLRPSIVSPASASFMVSPPGVVPPPGGS